MNNKISKISCLIFTFASLACMTGHASEIDLAQPEAVDPMALVDFELNYDANFNGMRIKAVHTLTQPNKGQYKEFFQAKGVLGSVTETELFEITSDEQIIPMKMSTNAQ